MRARISRAMEAALSSLAQRQDGAGAFQLFACKTRDMQTLRADSSPFGTMQVVHSLRGFQDPLAARLRDKGLGFILDRMEFPGVWRYWAALPVDLDDTACGAAGVRELAPWLGCDANVPMLLANRDAAGRFMTWVEPGFNSLDSVVNANVIWYLGESPQTRAAIGWIEQLVTSGREEETAYFYDDVFWLYYAIARAIRSGVEAWRGLGPLMAERVAIRWRNLPEAMDALRAAQALVVLGTVDRLAGPLAEAILERLLGGQREDGSWPLCPCWNAGAPPRPRFTWWGSEALTTAFCLEALGGLLASPWCRERRPGMP